MVSRTSDWRDELGRWLKPFVDRLGHKARRQIQAPVIQLPTLKALPIPYLADLPGIGRVLFQQPALTYAALVLTLAISVLLAKTRTGLMLRAVGENPEAAFTSLVVVTHGANDRGDPEEGGMVIVKPDPGSAAKLRTLGRIPPLPLGP